MVNKLILAAALALGATPAFAQHRGQVYRPKPEEQTVTAKQNDGSSQRSKAEERTQKVESAKCHCPCSTKESH